MAESWNDIQVDFLETVDKAEFAAGLLRGNGLYYVKNLGN
jgi:hypothetical protein